MKAFKSFVVTLVVILAIGGIYLYNRDSVQEVVRTYSTGKNEDKNKDSNNVDDQENADNSSDNTITGAIDSAKKAVVKKAAKVVVEKAIEQYADNAGDEVKEALETISEEDKDKVSEIISENISLESMDDVESYISGRDMDGLMDYAQDKLTEEDYSELTGIFEKYSDEVLQKMDGVTD